MGENPRSKRKRVVMELVKGKQIATRLQTRLRDPVQDHAVSHGELALQILRSFTKSLSEMSSCSEFPESTQIAAVDGSGSTCSVESEKKPAVKDRRGCYKRRKDSSDSWITVSQTMDDGRAWRKYGQKKILNSEFPRCYFRCTNKSQGCKATKQVQKLEEDPFMYQTTYFNHHTCTGTLIIYPRLNVDPDPVDPNLISFQIQSTPMNIISPTKEDSLVVIEESKEDNHISEAKVSPDPWEDILVGSDYWFGYQEAGSGFHSCGSTSFSGLDMEVNQLDDIGNFQFD